MGDVLIEVSIKVLYASWRIDDSYTRSDSTLLIFDKL